MLHAYNTISIPFLITNPQQTRTNSQQTAAYVDDANIKAGLPSNSTIRDIINIVTKNANTWEKLLWRTGGKLEISKCSIVIMKWIALPNGTFRLLTPQELPIPISINDSDTNQPITIPQLPPIKHINTSA